jgi:hypothetical protein
MELNFDVFKLGGLHEKHVVATWNLGTISAFALRWVYTKATIGNRAARGAIACCKLLTCR